MLFIQEKDFICNRKKTLFVTEKDITILGNDMATSVHASSVNMFKKKIDKYLAKAGYT